MTQLSPEQQPADLVGSVVNKQAPEDRGSSRRSSMIIGGSLVAIAGVILILIAWDGDTGLHVGGSAVPPYIFIFTGLGLLFVGATTACATLIVAALRR
jgi:hypothetical protein